MSDVPLDQLYREVDSKLLERAKKEVPKMKYVTPYRLSKRYDITFSMAKKILRILESEGLIVRYSGTRRTPIYVPASKEVKVKVSGVGVKSGYS